MGLLVCSFRSGQNGGSHPMIRAASRLRGSGWPRRCVALCVRAIGRARWEANVGYPGNAASRSSARYTPVHPAPSPWCERSVGESITQQGNCRADERLRAPPSFALSRALSSSSSRRACGTRRRMTPARRVRHMCATSRLATNFVETGWDAKEPAIVRMSGDCWSSTRFGSGFADTRVMVRFPAPPLFSVTVST